MTSSLDDVYDNQDRWNVRWRASLTFLHPIEGGEQIARAWIEIANVAPGNVTFLERTVNGQPGLVAQRDGVTITVFAFEIAGDQIKHIWVVRNPEKLRRWTMG